MNMAAYFKDTKGESRSLTHVFVISHTAIPKGRIPVYVEFVCAYKPHKADPHRVRMMVGGNIIEYPGEVTTKTDNLTVTNAILNIVCSTKAALYMNMDITNYYLGTPLERYEYVRISVNMVPEDIMNEYNLHALVHNGYLYVEVQKGMYGLPQAGLLANILLAKRLAKHGYSPVSHTHGLWTHKWRPIKFYLVVDDFGVMYFSREHVEHLQAALQENYEILTDWDRALYYGIKITWVYTSRTVDLSMPGYILAVLHRFQHPPPGAPATCFIQNAAYQLWRQSEICCTSVHIHTINWLSPILCQSSRFNNARSPQHVGICASTRHSRHRRCNTSATRLLRHSPRRRRPLSFIRHGTTSQQRCIIFVRTIGVKPHQRSFLSGQQRRPPTTYQWTNPMLVQYHQTCYVLRRGSRGGINLQQCKRSSAIATRVRRNGTPTAPNSNSNRQFDSLWNFEQQVEPKRSKAVDMHFYWVRDRIAQK
jgi:hypothetical protein